MLRPNDLHIGETSSGVIAGNLPQPVMQVPGAAAYPDVMLFALVAAPASADARIAAGDLTAEAARADASRP